MRITNVYFPRGISKIGLKPIAMERLGQTVVLAGRNGAGKTRLLNCLRGYDSGGAIQGNTMANIHRIMALDRMSAPSEKFWWLNDGILEMYIMRHWHRPDMASMKKQFSDMFLLEFDTDHEPVFVDFVPTTTSLADPRGWSPGQIQNFARQIETLGVGNLQMAVPGFIQATQTRWWNATHQHSTVSAAEKEKAIHDYSRLCEAIKRFLCTELTRSLDGDAELFGRPIVDAKMSHGQIILLQFCVAIYAQAEKLSDLIVFMDEPENHLHPDAMLNAICEIRKGLSGGQVWIATHSIPLLAHFDPDCIWWMEDGAVQHAGSQPEVVLRGLIGDEQRIEKLADFLGLPASLAANNFAYQCLLPPAVVQSSEGDPQTLQIQKIVEKYRPQELLRIVDFGAGRGRLISAIQESNLDKESIKKRIDYIAYDESNKFKKECETAIDRLYETSSGRYFNDERSMRSKLQSHSVDIIVMCNVLHEIEPIDWLPLFAEVGLIRWLLRPDGFLLIVEDTEMRIGEKAHQKGFIVLDTGDIRTFFKIQEKTPGFVVDDARNDGRLKAHLIPVNCLQNISADTLSETLKQVAHLAKEEIKVLRQHEPNYREGRKHAFYVQQFANAELALETLPKV